MLDVPGVEWADLDEAQNRFVVGVSRPAAREEIAKVLLEYEVPLVAVLFEEGEQPIDLVAVRDHGRLTKPCCGPPTITLRDRSDPVEGGFQIQNFDHIHARSASTSGGTTTTATCTEVS